MSPADYNLLSTFRRTSMTAGNLLAGHHPVLKLLVVEGESLVPSTDPLIPSDVYYAVDCSCRIRGNAFTGLAGAMDEWRAHADGVVQARLARRRRPAEEPVDDRPPPGSHPG